MPVLRNFFGRSPMKLAGVHLGLLQRMGLSIDSFGTADAPLDRLAG